MVCRAETHLLECLPPPDCGLWAGAADAAAGRPDWGFWIGATAVGCSLGCLVAAAAAAATPLESDWCLFVLAAAAAAWLLAAWCIC